MREVSCWQGQYGAFDEDFDIPRCETFPELLGSYGLFDGPMVEPAPAAAPRKSSRFGNLEIGPQCRALRCADF